ncbi:MAG: diacylglycerol kinase family lipid kinase, partial [Bacteroidota bacterium]|nr:diacylglycerol kinase family lipid kinase [Bacteroidota bacterium]
MEKLVFIVNPISGGKDKKKVLKVLEQGIDGSRFDWSVKMTEYAGHGREIALDCDADIVVAVGGDGTVSEVAQGVAGTKKHLGIIPCGSGDGLALHLGISRKPRKAVRQLNRSERAVMDYGTVEGKPFFCTTGVGMDAQVAWEFARDGRRGLKTYVSKTLSVWRTFEPGHYRLEIDGAVHELDATFITVANVNQWGNNAVIAPEATVTDGLFDITVLRPFRIWDIPGLALRLFTRRFTRSGKVDTFRGKKVVLHRECAA